MSPQVVSGSIKWPEDTNMLWSSMGRAKNCGYIYIKSIIQLQTYHPDQYSQHFWDLLCVLYMLYQMIRYIVYSVFDLLFLFIHNIWYNDIIYDSIWCNIIQSNTIQYSTCIRPSKQNIPHFVFEKIQDDGQMQRVQIFQALPVLLLVLLTLASNFAKDGARGRCWVF